MNKTRPTPRPKPRRQPHQIRRPPGKSAGVHRPGQSKRSASQANRPPLLSPALSSRPPSSRLSFRALQRAMRIAQSLYEAGHITYMRTDSTNLSADAISMVRSYITKTFGDRYVPEKKANVYSSTINPRRKPTKRIFVLRMPASIPPLPTQNSAPMNPRLYQLIWNRFGRLPDDSRGIRRHNHHHRRRRRHPPRLRPQARL